MEGYKLIEVPKISDKRGCLSFIEEDNHIPFKISRAFWIYDVPGSEVRGQHAHKECHELMVAISGSFEVEIDDGRNENTVVLDQPHHGLYISPGIWTTVKDFSPGAVCLVFVSHKYNEEDYIHNYQDYLNLNDG